MTSISSLSSQNMAAMQRQLFSRIDTDGNGAVSQQEFVNARPDDVSESDAQSMFKKLDKSNSGSLSESDFVNSAPPPLSNLSTDTLATLLQSQDQTQTASTSATDGSSGLSDMFSKLDTDGDGKVSKEEFVAGRPKGVSEDQASSLFDKVDSDGTGSVSQDQFVTGMEQNRPAGGPPAGGMGGAHHHHHSGQSSDQQANGTSSTDDPTGMSALLAALQADSDDDDSSSGSTSSTSSASDALLQAIKSYSQSLNTNSISASTESTLLAA